MEITRELHHGICDVTFRGAFTFNDHLAFREVLAMFDAPAVEQVVFHMAGVNFIDSSALGMLLLALDESSKHDKMLSITGATGQVKKMFDLSRFDALFGVH